MSFAEKLRMSRKRKKLTQEQVADMIGVAKSTYACYEGGSREPDFFKIKKMLDVLEVSADYLLETPYDETPLIDDCDIAESYAQLDAVDRADVKGYINGLLRADKYNKSNNQSNAC
jgi:transcriptional regulator with XRE-family HTH domain